MSRAVVRPTLTALAAVACLTLAACSGTAQAEPTVAAPTPSPSPTPSAPPEVQCLESGTWVLDLAREDALRIEMYRTLARKYESQTVGERTYTFTDGELATTYSGVVESSVLVFLQTPQIEAQITSATDGTAVAPYTATATQVEVGAGDASGITHEYTVLENGVPWTPESDPQENTRTELERPRTWGFECSEDTLRLIRTQDGVAPDPVEESDVLLLTRR